MDVGVETITPEIAAKYLAKRDEDRPLSNGHLKYLKERQRRGEWKTNGDSIKFDAHGCLRDGQHRLMMVMETEIPIEVVVVRDLEPTAFITMDTGKNRNLSDGLAIAKKPNPLHLGPALSWVRKYLVDYMNSTKGISFEQHLEVLDMHPELHHSVEFRLSLGKPPGSPGFPAVTTATHYLFSRIDHEQADDFTERYVTGLRLEERTDPVAVLRGRVLSFALQKKIHIEGQQILRLHALAWNALRAERPVKMPYKLPDLGARRPKIDGFPKDLFLESRGELLPSEEQEDEEET